MTHRVTHKCEGMPHAAVLLACLLLFSAATALAQTNRTPHPNTKKISPDLFGLFFEDINYAADGGLYAELVQNRSFEYSPTDRKEWHPFSFWEYVTPGFSYGSVGIETHKPVHPNNPHYVVLNVEHAGTGGVGLKNHGFDGMVVRSGDNYDLSFFARQLSAEPITLSVSLQTPRGEILAEQKMSTSSEDWTQYTTRLTPLTSHDSATLVILATTKGRLALDMISLFPEKTFMNRKNGLRSDLAKLLADMKPAFIRFPGGCLVHGDGLGNMYRWKNTIGPIEQRIEQKNIWGYHQTMGLGYYEYFQFCEDIGAKPLPVLPAAVSCQNSGGTWRIGGTGQRVLPMEEMQPYIQEVLDLIEWANGPASSTWGAKRVAAGHAAPFHLEYIGIGNEDKITPEFEQRFRMIYDAVKRKYPEVTVVGTVGPLPAGEDYTKGWKIANEVHVPIVDEHYYSKPEWFISNQGRYDAYDRTRSEVYVGEYATWGNKMQNAMAEAVYMTALERNGDVVRMASYAPLFAKKGFTQWRPDMIFFDNTQACPTVNYQVQKLFSVNRGDVYIDKIVTWNSTDSTTAASCVQDNKTGDVILKLVNAGKDPQTLRIDLSHFKHIIRKAEQIILTGKPDAENTIEHPQEITPVRTVLDVNTKFSYIALPMSLTVVRVKTR